MKNSITAIKSRIDKKDKEIATGILNMSTYINAVNPKPSKELIEAIKEGEDILNGKIKIKGYHNVRKMFDDILNEIN